LKRWEFRTYTAMDIQMEAVPFLVEGKLQPAIPRQPGIYFLLQEASILYVGQTAESLRIRISAYKADRKSTHVWWHVVDPEWLTIYEWLYIRDLDPALNGRYHGNPLASKLSLEELERHEAEEQEKLWAMVLSL
jgi:hypothetical protein